MLYLAEVQKRAIGFGIAKSDLRLLACQRTPDVWNVLATEELLEDIKDPANIKDIKDGALVLAEVSASKQVQKVEDASRKLGGILQGLSKKLERSTNQGEEIEQWKQSLTFQAQELNRREMEVQAREERIQQLEEDFEQLQLEEQSQEIQRAREEVTRLQAEVERNRSELQGAWAHLEGEKRKLEERLEEAQGKSALGMEEAQRIQDLLARVANTISPTESLRESLNQGFEAISSKQQILDGCWQDLESKRNEAHQLQSTVDQRVTEMEHLWQQWHQDQESLNHLRLELKHHQDRLEFKQAQVALLSPKSHALETLYQNLCQAAGIADPASSAVDVERLNTMPLDELESLVQNLQREFEKVSRSLRDQEEELADRQQILEEIRAKMQNATDFDRLTLEGELADEEEGYQLLNQSLSGPRRAKREKEVVLKQHVAVLERRQGKVAESSEPEADLTPIVTECDNVFKALVEDLQQCTAELEQLQVQVQQSQANVEQQAAAQEGRRQELRNLEQDLLKQQRASAELWGRVNLYQEVLQPIQDRVNGMRQSLEGIAGILAQVQEMADSQMAAINEMNQLFQDLTR